MTENDFRELISRVRAGDVGAARELHNRYGEQLQRIVRVRLTNAVLRRQFDSMDVCQSVFADFFVRMSEGQYDISDPNDLMKLLATMARHSVIRRAEQQKAAKRDVRRVGTAPVDELAIPADDATPSQVVAAEEILEKLRLAMGEEVLAIVDQRRGGKTWDEIGLAVGKSGDAIRKQYERAFDEAMKSLGLR